MMDMTIRELDAFAEGRDRAKRAEAATALWQAHQTALFMAHVWAGKRIPDIEKRLAAIMSGGSVAEQSVISVVAAMNEIARKAGLPKPRKRRIDPTDAHDMVRND